MTFFRKIVPNSEENDVNERYEHFLIWISTNGGVRQWLFSHTDGSEQDSIKREEIETLSDIRSIPHTIVKSFSCESKYMSLDEFNYVSSLLKSNRAYKVTKSGDMIPIGITSSRIKKDNQVKNFDLSFEFKLKQEDVLNV